MASLILPPNPTLPYPRQTLFLKPHLRRRHHISCCSSSEIAKPELTTELPIFPLPLVLFPGAILPLQIFEFRYRIMMHTLLQSDLRFGVLFSTSDASSSDVGCVAEIVKHEKLSDDRFFLIAKGQERFRINRLQRTKPYLVADVSWLEDRPPPPSDDENQSKESLEALADEVEKLMRDVIRISNRLNGKKKDEEEIGGDLRKGMFPTMFSFFVGSTFEGAPREQQALLEMEETGARLMRERDTLRNTLNYLTAAAAVKDVFPSSSSSSGMQFDGRASSRF